MVLNDHAIHGYKNKEDEYINVLPQNMKSNIPNKNKIKISKKKTWSLIPKIKFNLPICKSPKFKYQSKKTKNPNIYAGEMNKNKS